MLYAQFAAASKESIENQDIWKALDLIEDFLTSNTAFSQLTDSNNAFHLLNAQHNYIEDKFESEGITEAERKVYIQPLFQSTVELIEKISSIMEELEAAEAAQAKELNKLQEIELVLEGDLLQYTLDAQHQLLQAIATSLNVNERIKIKKYAFDRIKFHILIPAEKTSVFFKNFKAGRFSDFGLTNTSLILESTPESKTASRARSLVKKSRATSKSKSFDPAPILASQYEDADQAMQQAKLLKTRGRLDIAIELLAEALKQFPDDDELHYLLANYYRLQSRQGHKEAIELLKRAIELNPKSVKYYNELGLVYNIVGEIEHAIDTLRTSLSVNPRSSLAARLLADALYQNGDIVKAFYVVQESLRFNKKNIFLNKLSELIAGKTNDLLFHLEVDQLMTEGRLDEALNMLEKYYAEADDALLDHIADLKRRDNEINFKLWGGVISAQQANIQRNEIIDEIVNILKDN